MVESQPFTLCWHSRWDWPAVLLLALLLCGLGYGLRDPWPPDEPRFALVAQEMLASGDWLIPRRGGEIYPDKPPLFMWASALSQSVLGLRWGFLLPSLMASLGICALVFDLAKRLGDRRHGWLALAALFGTAQFLIQAWSAQIDIVLVLWTTLGVYGLVRHLILGPSWGWCWMSALAVGLGVITKGVGFLPLLLFMPWGLIRWRWSGHVPAVAVSSIWRWLVFALLILVPIAAWLLPLLALAADDPALAAYRDEILFKQTAGRYANAWHHQQWFGYLVMMAPILWLPLSGLLPWLAISWHARWRNGDGRLAVLLGWIILVLIFFSGSTGKRGVYVLPAVPVLAVAAGLVLPDVLLRARLRAAAWWMAMSFGVLLLVAAVVWRFIPKLVKHIEQMPGVSPTVTLAGLACAIVGLGLWTTPRRGWLLWLGVVVALAVTYGGWVVPHMNQLKSAVPVMTKMERTVPSTDEVGVPSWREQILLHAPRSLTHFGYRKPEDERWEAAAAWYAAGSNRWLLVTKGSMTDHWGGIPSEAVPLGRRGRRSWYVVPPGLTLSSIRTSDTKP